MKAWQDVYGTVSGRDLKDTNVQSLVIKALQQASDFWNYFKVSAFWNPYHQEPCPSDKASKRKHDSAATQRENELLQAQIDEQQIVLGQVCQQLADLKAQFETVSGVDKMQLLHKVRNLETDYDALFTEHEDLKRIALSREVGLIFLAKKLNDKASKISELQEEVQRLTQVISQMVEGPASRRRTGMSKEQEDVEKAKFLEELMALDAGDEEELLSKLLEKCRVSVP